MRVFSIALILLLSLSAASRADVESGPAVGAKAPALKVLAMTGDHEGKEIDYAADREDKPTIYIFVKGEHFERPTARFLKVLDAAAPKVARKCEIVAVWLTDDADAAKAYLPRVQKSMQFDATPLCVFSGKKSGPEDWGVNLDADVTAVVVTDKTVRASFGYRSVNDTSVPEVEAALKKAVEAK
ncbi:MAG TPA: hypothetical protein VGJ26_15275 [Pirellulales bacterium]|jgi:hypothetical protein